MKKRLMFLAAMLTMVPVAAAVVARSEDSVATPGSSSGAQYQ